MGTACPECGIEMDVRVDDLPFEIECPHCRTVLLVHGIMPWEDPEFLHPMSENDAFHFVEGTTSKFEEMAHQNGFLHWYARDIMPMLGYSSWSAFEKAIQKAFATCTNADINLFDNFEQVTREVDGTMVRDYKLSRFACYMVAMNADSNKPEVARAQAYFAALAEAFQRYVERTEDVERVLIRGEVSAREKTLSHAAIQAGVEKLGNFQNAGYRGMYNMNLWDLKLLKGVPADRSPLDFMGKEELAANLFRITQTEAKLRNDGIRGQAQAEHTAETVGRKVRRTMMDISGTAPEALPPGQDIKEVRKSLKSSHRDFKKLDSPKKKRK